MEMELIQASLDFCRGCQGHSVSKEAGEFYFCDRLGVIAQKISGLSWFIFTNFNEERLRRLIAIGMKGMMDDIFTKSEGRA